MYFLYCTAEIYSPHFKQLGTRRLETLSNWSTDSSFIYWTEKTRKIKKWPFPVLLSSALAYTPARYGSFVNDSLLSMFLFHACMNVPLFDHAQGPYLYLWLYQFYVHSRIDSNTCTMTNSMPESTLTLSQSRLYPPVQGLWIWPHVWFHVVCSPCLKN